MAEDLLRYMIATSSAAHERAWARGLGLDEARFTALCTERGRPWALTPATLRGDAPHPFADLPLFADASERPVALREIDAAIEADGFVRVITLGRPPLRKPPAFVVRVGDLRANLLDALYGKAKVRRIGREYARWVVLETLRASQPEPMVIEGACALGPMEVTLEGRRVLVGLRSADLQSGTKRQEARVFLDGRPVTTAKLEAACSLEFLVEIDEADLDDDARGVTAPGLVRVRDTAAAGLGQALDRLLESAPDLPPTLATFVVEALELALPGPGFAAAWSALWREHDAIRCIASYVELLAIADVHAPDRVDAALLALLRTDAPLTRPEVTAKLGEPLRADNGWSRLRTAAAERLPQLLRAPALATAGGDALAVQGVFDAIASAGSFGYLREDDDVPPVLASVAVLRGELLLAMLRIFGNKRLRDRTDELEAARRRRAFELRAAPTELALSDDTLASIDVEADGIRGVLGVPRRPPTSGPGAIRITNARRPVATVDPMPDTAWIGILDGDGFGEELDYADLTPREVQRVHALLVSHRPMILAALLTVHAARPDDHTRSWLQHLLRQVLPPRGNDPAALGNAGVSALISLPLFVDPDGAPLTLLDLRAQFEEHRCLAVVRSAGLKLDRRLVWVRDDVEHTLLRHLFGLLKEVDEAAARWARQAAWVAAAPPLPAAPTDAFVVETVESRRVNGALWLAPGVDASTMIDIGIEGRALSKWLVSRMFPCAGAITGEAVTVNAAVDGCEISNSRADHLESVAARLYLRLLESMRPDFAPVDDPRCVLLRDLLLRLHEIHQAKRKWPNHDMRRLYRELEDAPLLPLASGRGVSLRTAMRTMPDELAALRPASAETDIDDAPHDAAPAPTVEPMVPPQVGAPAPTATIEPIPSPQLATAAPPEPPEPPPAPRPDQVLRERILAELRLLHRRDMQLLRESHLDVVTVRDLGGPHVVTLRDGAVIVDSGHAVVRRALGADTDPLLVSVLVSAVLTALNIAYEEFTDAEEGLLLRLHADHLRTARSPPPQDGSEP